MPAGHRGRRSDRGGRAATGGGGRVVAERDRSCRRLDRGAGAPARHARFRVRRAGAVARAADADDRSLPGWRSRRLAKRFAIWAAGHLNKSREVTASGPYRWVAHPLYVGSSIMGVGLAIASGSLIVAVVIAVVSGGDADGGDQERGGVSAADLRRSVRPVPQRTSRRRARRVHATVQPGAGDGESRVPRGRRPVGRDVAARVEGNV